MKLDRKRTIWRCIIIALLPIAAIIGYIQHGTLADAAIYGTLASAAGLCGLGVGFAADRGWFGKILCRLGLHRNKYAEVTDGQMRYNTDGSRRGKTVGVVKCVRCGKPLIHLVSMRDDAAIEALYPKRHRR